MTRDLAIPKQGQLIKENRAPDAINALINMEMWAQSIVYGTKYTEPTEDYLSRMLAFQVITAPSIEEALQQANIVGLQEAIPNVPNATSGPIEIIDLYVAASDFDTGNPCYVIMTVIDLVTGEEHKWTTGATNVQASLIALIAFGTWPIRVQIKRGDTKDKGGRYLLFMLPPD